MLYITFYVLLSMVFKWFPVDIRSFTFACLVRAVSCFYVLNELYYMSFCLLH